MRPRGLGFRALNPKPYGETLPQPDDHGHRACAASPDLPGREFQGCIRLPLGLYGDNGKENGN